jgi:hypothetical protein
MLNHIERLFNLLHVCFEFHHFFVNQVLPFLSGDVSDVYGSDGCSFVKFEGFGGAEVSQTTDYVGVFESEGIVELVG